MSPALEQAMAAMGDAARAAVAARIEASIQAYDRDTTLPRLIRIAPGDLADTPEARAAIIARLRKAKQAAVNMLRNGHWAADGNRLIALRTALAAEERALAADVQVAA